MLPICRLGHDSVILFFFAAEGDEDNTTIFPDLTMALNGTQSLHSDHNPYLCALRNAELIWNRVQH